VIFDDSIDSFLHNLLLDPKFGLFIRFDLTVSLIVLSFLKEFEQMVWLFAFLDVVNL
jgi:hypothetical protein